MPLILFVDGGKLNMKQLLNAENFKGKSIQPLLFKNIGKVIFINFLKKKRYIKYKFCNIFLKNILTNIIYI